MATSSQTERAGPSMTTDVGHRPRRRTRGSVGMRGVLATLAMVALALVATAVPAHAGQSDHLNRLFSGPFAGIGVVGSDPDCPFFHVTHYENYGEGRPPPASGTTEMVACVDIRTVPWSGTGTFTITTRTGATLFGTVLESAAFPAGAFENTFGVTGGTRQFRHVRGTIVVTGFVDRTVGTITGTHTASLRKV
jgi:hypothetical protein